MRKSKTAKALEGQSQGVDIYEVIRKESKGSLTTENPNEKGRLVPRSP